MDPILFQSSYISETGSLYSPGCPGWLQTHKDPPASASQCWDQEGICHHHSWPMSSVNFHSFQLRFKSVILSQLWMRSQHTRQTHMCILPVPCSTPGKHTCVFSLCPFHKEHLLNPGTYCVTHLGTLGTKEGKVVAGQGHPELQSKVLSPNTKQISRQKTVSLETAPFP